MTSSISTPAIYQFNNKEFRIIDKNGEPWFIASDVCDILELGNITEALRSLDDDEKAEFSINEVSSNGVEQNRKRVIINEPGYYSLILRSRKPEAKEFKRLVTHEILPSIHKTGSYTLSSTVAVSITSENRIPIQTFNGQAENYIIQNCLTEKTFGGRDDVTTRNRYSTVDQPRKNVGFFVFMPNRCRNLSNKALPNKTGRSRVRFLVPTPFSIGEKVNTINPLERKLYND